MHYLGIDLGGTNVAAAVVDREGTILGKVSLPTPRTGAEAVADQMAAAARAAAEKAGVPLEQVESVGIGSPGTIEPEQGLIRFWSNLNFVDVPLGGLMEARLHKKIYLENDANAAALGEYAAGAGKGSQSMVAITLGTGVGGGAVLNGKLYTGFNYAGMEVGHFVIEYGGRLCTCGRKGCFEAYCSATALIKRTREVMEEHPDSLLWQLAGSLEGVDGRTPFDAAAQGDAAAGKVIDEYVNYLGCGVASLVNIFQPEVFCIGGGPSAQGETLMAPVRYILNREDYARNSVRRTRLVRAALGNDAGIIGAALLPLFR
ncbi:MULTISPECIES: ROK family protein [Oscillospiraceae]|uniref:ROK family protein n=1 Tax=Oscillospiraceae TaxID=216572 RepID=UPI000B3A5A7E|nr:MULTISPECIES: ROK family protein [Oscillospiraceae]MBM6885141.1 ROK family protein [Pseudoflavonifractor phocaeensis]OUO44749.1 glucokinase [Flavonifractor sp. An306]